MCNAHNHAYDCNCGWGGEGHLGVRRTRNEAVEVGGSSDHERKGLTHKTNCWWCGSDVYFYRNENGGCVLLDELIPPWPVHPCWSAYDQTQQKAAIMSELQSVEFDEGSRAIDVTTSEHVGSLYSPFPPARYTRADSNGLGLGVGSEFRDVERRAIWNLYWLSDAAVDSFLLEEAAWGHAPSINIDMLTACFQSMRQDCGGKTVKSLIETMTPSQFVSHLRRNEYKHLAPYLVTGDSWMRIMESRATQFRGLLFQVGNVSHVQFR